jgi:hypothetical protein
MLFFNIISNFFKKVKRALKKEKISAPVLFSTDGKLKFFNFQRKSTRICARTGEYGRRPTFALILGAYGGVVVMRSALSWS